MPQKVLYRAIGTGLATLIAIFFLRFPENTLPDVAAHFLSDQVNDGFQILSHLLMVFLSWRWRSWRPLLLDLTVSTVVTGLVQLSKQHLFIPIALRPSGGYEGFPSGHASATFSLAFLLSLYYPRLWWAWYLTAALVTWSRVQTYANSELQVVVGLIFGTFMAWWFAKMIWRRRIIERYGWRK